MDKLLNRIKKVEKTLKKGQTIVRFIEVIDKGYLIAQSTKQAEIGTKLKSLTDIDRLTDIESITFIENVTE